MFFYYNILREIFADLFPATEGNQWVFRFTSYQSWMGIWASDSGIVYWKIIGKENSDCTNSNSVENRITIKIEQRKEIYKIVSAGYYSSSYYDSIFTAPKVLTDTLTFIDSGSIIYNSKDSCQLLLHTINNHEKYLLIKDTTSLYRGKSISTTKINRIFSDSIQKCDRPVYFILGEDIGPVSFHNGESLCVFDVSFSVGFTLIDYSLKNTAITNKYQKQLLPHIINNNIISLPAEYRNANSSAEILQINGKCVWKKRLNKDSQLVLPVNNLGAGFYLLRIPSAGKPIMFESFVVDMK